MVVPSMCHICGAPTTTTCSMCGRPVCGGHVEKFSRMCVSCLAPRGRPPRTAAP